MPLRRESAGLLFTHRAAFRGRGVAGYASCGGFGSVLEEGGKEVSSLNLYRPCLGRVVG
jgi:hypothetical protein